MHRERLFLPIVRNVRPTRLPSDAVKMLILLQLFSSETRAVFGQEDHLARMSVRISSTRALPKEAYAHVHEMIMLTNATGHTLHQSNPCFPNRKRQV